MNNVFIVLLLEDRTNELTTENNTFVLVSLFCKCLIDNDWVINIA